MVERTDRKYRRQQWKESWVRNSFEGKTRQEKRREWHESWKELFKIG